MKFLVRYLILPLFVVLLFVSDIMAATGRYRLIWQDDPSTTMIIGWDQLSGSGGKVFFDVVNHGEFPTKFAFSKNPANVIQAKGMSNHFVGLAGLRPNTVYYFVVADSEGSSPVFSFRTAPNNGERLSIVAGSDSRNHRTARVDANKMVSKLRPHVVLFGGDFTENDSDVQWKQWFDDWQSTVSKDGRMYPLIVARGNHEYSNKTLIQLFDVKYKGINYALNIGGDLLRVYTLNSMVASGGEQRSWLQRDLAANPHITWKIAQYHLSTRPHCSKKGENNDQWGNWSKLFYEYGVDLVVESDAHTVKSTYPLKPSTEEGSEEGFIRDDAKGTVYIGEGCWGAPLRRSDDPKKWTRASGSFNSFHLIFVDQNKMEIRFVKTDGADAVAEVNPNNIFVMPRGINIWNPPTGDVIYIEKQDDIYNIDDTPDIVMRGAVSAEKSFEILDLEISQHGNDIKVNWKTINEPHNVHYEILRSVNKGEYKTIKTVASKRTPQSSYQFVDVNFASSNRNVEVNYRVNSVLSGNDKPPVAKVEDEIKGNQKPNVSPSKFPSVKVDPLTGKGPLKFLTRRAGSTKARLFKGRGKMIKEWQLEILKPGKQVKEIDFSGVPPGRYVLVLYSIGGQKPLRKYKVRI